MRSEYVATMQPNYYPPKLGRLAIVLLALLLANTVIIYTYYGRTLSDATTPSLTRGMYVMVGAMYGWAATISWILSAVERRYLRWTLQLAVTLLFAAGLQGLSSDVYVRYVSSLGGLIFVQTVMFNWLRIPRWRKPGWREDDSNESRSFGQQRQFGIGEIIAATACFAVLFSIAIRYRSDQTDGVYYWATLASFWVIAPLSSASMTVAVLGQRTLVVTFAWMFLSVAITILAAGGLSLAQVWILQRQEGLLGYPYWSLTQLLLIAYSILLLTTLGLFAFVAWCGRWQYFFDINRAEAESHLESQDMALNSE